MAMRRGPGEAEGLDRVLKPEMRSHTVRAPPELREEAVCSFWKLEVWQDLYLT